MAAICSSRGLAPLRGGMGAWLPGIRDSRNTGALNQSKGNICRFPMAPAPLGAGCNLVAWIRDLPDSSRP